MACSTIAAVSSAFSRVGEAVTSWFRSKEAADTKESGREELAAKINKETAERLDEMAKVNPRPSEDEVAGRLGDGTF